MARLGLGRLLAQVGSSRRGAWGTAGQGGNREQPTSEGRHGLLVGPRRRAKAGPWHGPV